MQSFEAGFQSVIFWIHNHNPSCTLCVLILYFYCILIHLNVERTPIHVLILYIPSVPLVILCLRLPVYIHITHQPHLECKSLGLALMWFCFVLSSTSVVTGTISETESSRAVPVKMDLLDYKFTKGLDYMLVCAPLKMQFLTCLVLYYIYKKDGNCSMKYYYWLLKSTSPYTWLKSLLAPWIDYQ